VVVQINQSVAPNSTVNLSSPGVTFYSPDGYLQLQNSAGTTAFAMHRAMIGSTFFQSGPAVFDASYAQGSIWVWEAQPSPNGKNGAKTGENWVALNTNTVSSVGQMQGWLSFTLDASGYVSSFNKFVYDPSSTIGLSDAIQASAVPEISGGLVAASLLLVGAISHRRRSSLIPAGA
jgi:hypothetical protein